MIKTLRIASFALAAVTVCGVVVFALLLFKKDTETRIFLEKQGVIEQLKTQTSAATQKQDAISPLVTQAKAFALRIDPPPPPPPPAPKPSPDTARPGPRPEVVITPPQPVAANFELLATAWFEHHPERSLALLKQVSESAKWRRQGEKIGHLQIQEIRQGSVVLYQDGKLNSELFVPAAKSTFKPLLKADAKTWSPTVGSAVATAAVEPSTPGAATNVEVGAPGSSRIVRSVTRRAPTVTRVQRAAPAPAPEPTLEERKQSLQESISSIEEIMKSTDAELSPEEQQANKEMWSQFLVELKKEKENLEAEGAEDHKPAEPNATEE